MKKLQETSEEIWDFTSYAEMRGVIRRAQDPKMVVLLLHGLGERGKRIYRKLLPHLPEDSTIIAPNGPFPIARERDGRLDYVHSWYFYDKSEKKYFINQDLAKYWLRDLVKIENPNKLPVVIIGFSQGGYLAPLAGKEIIETELVIGLSCEFRTTLISEKLPFKLLGIHGCEDEIVKMEWAKDQIRELKKLNLDIDFHELPGGHEITFEMGKYIQSYLETYGKRSL